MELRFDHEDWLAQSFAASFATGVDAGRSAMDWHGLATRLAAAHAFQRDCGEAPAMLAGGSFDPHVARLLHDYAPVWDDLSASCKGAFQDVNPVFRGVRKTMSGIEFGVAGPRHPGDRGMK
ncbi:MULTISPECIES: hypothetical protein [unclassified Novosphingobium]|uniref:hypothetical protein n=1 Tax=unclassified Novosphingobium TaxID=2644732 RepID=UPI00086B6856|nr:MULTISPECIES: hypothetical protein [unclassified Novosphingobium]MBN9142794.1 hypothetical protein [Novosphingobium sp.]NKJ00194.1 hypothetical protein [Novosphingobium sp. SG707]ODU85040.1 MAG: hypothetical protein ABT10_02005 [Novosphingobium sp. SCN 63-17]OJX89182.1 MAG: hypothetical protein BGP00_13075 [Novosphingobium sp. 63-713]